MVTPAKIAEYIENVPPLPQNVRVTLQALEAGELAAAATSASTDPALIHYLQRIVNSAAYGFRNELKDPRQIFSALGIQRAKQLLYAYLVATIAPKRWHYFAIENRDFHEFQAALMGKWEKIVGALGVEEKYLSAAAVLTAGLVVADAIFGEHASEVALIRESGDLDLDTILERVARLDFEKLVVTIATKWEVDEEVRKVVALAFGKRECDLQESVCRLARMLHLLLFYELSRPKMLDAGANAFVAFNPEFADPVLESFQEIMEMA